MSLLFLPKWMKVLSLINGRVTQSNLARKVKITFSHWILISNELMEGGLLKKEEKIGRCVPITLTEKGTVIKEAVMTIIQSAKLNGRSRTP